MCTLFSLAERMKPCIVYVEVVESFLRREEDGEHESCAFMKAEFMKMWDEFSTDCKQPNIMIIKYHPCVIFFYEEGLVYLRVQVLYGKYKNKYS